MNVDKEYCDICETLQPVYIVPNRQDEDEDMRLCGACYVAYMNDCPCGCDGDTSNCVYTPEHTPGTYVNGGKRYER